jgi:hypothetical protein
VRTYTHTQSYTHKRQELARIVDLEVEQGEGGAYKCRSGVLSPNRLPGGGGGGDLTSPATRTPFTTPADKKKACVNTSTDAGARSEGLGGGGMIFCNGSPMIRETLGKSFVSPVRSSPAMGVDIGDLGMVAERVEGGAEGGDFVYDYYWMDPDSAHAAVLADGKVCAL